MFAKTKDNQEFVKMWGNRRKHKWFYVFLFGLAWGLFVGCTVAWILDLIGEQTSNLKVYVIYFAVNWIGGVFFGLSSFKLNEKKYQQILMWETGDQ